MNDVAALARRLVRGSDSGALSTHSLHHPGYPFGSLVSFALDSKACPVILISRLAEHSRNLESDPRSSVLVRQPGADPLAAPRITLVTDAVACASDPLFEARFLRYLPQARGLLQLGDFRFVRLQPSAVRYIGGFGVIHWISAADYAPPPNEIAEAEPQLLNTIPTEQGSALRALCRGRLGRELAQADLIGIDCDGLDLRAENTRFRFDFPRPATSAAEVAPAIAALADEKN